ncbi:hypothetical protein [Streptomyces cadmiisoli]|uniref:hypothetical protein n=1 Tax=Streptomyces cadmiisoli TaxID=2184053 RepID=UPI003D7434A0
MVHPGELNVIACPTDPDHPRYWRIQWLAGSAWSGNMLIGARVLSLLMNIEHAATRLPPEALNNCCRNR